MCVCGIHLDNIIWFNIVEIGLLRERSVRLFIHGKK